MKKYKGIIFDLDGTLLDTIEDLGDSMNEVLIKYGLPTFNKYEYKKKVGGGFKGLVLNSFPPETNRVIIDEATKLYTEVYDKKYLDKTKPYEGIEEILNELTNRNIILGINSNKRDNYTNNLVYRFFKKIPFVKVYGERSEIPIKPNPVSALDIANAMKLEPSEVLYIGDSNVDIMTANNAGMDSVGVLWGFRDKIELEKYGATHIVSEPKAILKLL